MSRRDRLPRRYRGARLAGAIGRRAARHTSTRIGNVFRDHGSAEELTARRHRETAAHLGRTFGTLKGGAAKLGQLASFVELDFIPDEYREIYRSEFASLRDAAPPMSWVDVRSVLEEEWGNAPESLLEDLDHTPAAAASLGQVHRGSLPGGRRVAIKVQYPDVAAALATELRSVLRLLPLLRAIAPAFDAEAVGAELRGSLLAELDYAGEGLNQATFACAYRGHPFISVPEVHFPLTRRRVLVTDWVDGLRFPAVRELPQPERDRFGEILFRFYFGAIPVVGRFNADPHPGNYLLRPDGTVAFVDFGSVKMVTPRLLEHIASILRSGASRDPAAVRDAMARIGFTRARERVDPELAMRWLELSSGWMLADRPVTIDAEVARRQLPLGGDGAFAVARRVPDVDLPPDELLLGRMRTSLVAVLAQLRATANWHRIVREWLDAEPPGTQLGAAEQAFLAHPHDGA